MLAVASQLRQIDREKGSVDEAVDEMIDEFAEDEDCCLWLSKHHMQTGKHLPGAGCPNVEFLANL